MSDLLYNWRTGTTVLEPEPSPFTATDIERWANETAAYARDFGMAAQLLAALQREEASPNSETAA